jgi:multiple sugar transport system substrate-binding protein
MPDAGSKAALHAALRKIPMPPWTSAAGRRPRVAHRASSAALAALVPHPRARRLLLLLALLSLLGLIAACSGGDTASHDGVASRSAPQAHRTTITWSFWGDSWEVETNRRLLRAFEQAHPDIHVEVAHHPWGEYFDWLRGEWQAGRSPDVMFLNYIPSYAAMGELEPLDGYIARDGVQLGDFYPALLDSFRAQGRLYGLPRDNDTKVIYYNRAHFQEAGLPEPTDGWTWDDLRRDAIALTKHDGLTTRYGFGFEPDYWWLVWMWQRGCDVLDDPLRPTTVRLDEPACAEALGFLQDLIYTDRVTPPPSQLNTDDMSRLFRDGRLSMVFGNHTLVPWFSETDNLSWDVAPLPRSHERVNVAGGAGFVISRRSEHKDAAWTLVKFLTSAEAQAMLAESGVITPARRSVREDSIFLRRQPYHADVFVTETEQGRPVPNFPGVTEMERVMDRGLAPLWRGEQTPAEVLQALAPAVQQVIDRSPVHGPEP